MHAPVPVPAALLSRDRKKVDGAPSPARPEGVFRPSGDVFRQHLKTWAWPGISW
jgi:hypothetical protein